MVVLASDWNTRKVVLRMLAAMMLYVCISTVADTVPVDDSRYYGFDVLTISGDRSSMEVFAVGGVFVLHDFSLFVPGCEFCKTVKFQVDHSPVVGMQSPEVSARIVPTPYTADRANSVCLRTYFTQPLALISWDDDLDFPPPRLQ